MSGQTKETTWSVLTSVGEGDSEPQYLGINPRLDTLDGKTIGLFEAISESG